MGFPLPAISQKSARNPRTSWFSLQRPGNLVACTQKESPQLSRLHSVARATGEQEPLVVLGLALGHRGSLSHLYEAVTPATLGGLMW